MDLYNVKLCNGSGEKDLEVRRDLSTETHISNMLLGTWRIVRNVWMRFTHKGKTMVKRITTTMMRPKLECSEWCDLRTKWK